MQHRPVGATLLLVCAVLAGCASTGVVPKIHIQIDEPRITNNFKHEPFTVLAGDGALSVELFGNGTGSVDAFAQYPGNETDASDRLHVDALGPIRGNQTTCLRPGNYTLVVDYRAFKGFVDAEVRALHVAQDCPAFVPLSPPTPSPLPTKPWWSSIDPVNAFGVVTTAILGSGTLLLGVAQYRRGQARRNQGKTQDPANRIQQRADGNQGPVIASADKVIINSSRERSINSSVSPRWGALYQSLLEARDVLDDPGAGGRAVSARDLVQGLLGTLEAGQYPGAALRKSVAAAIQEAATHPGSSRIRNGKATLQVAIRKLE